MIAARRLCQSFAQRGAVSNAVNNLLAPATATSQPTSAFATTTSRQFSAVSFVEQESPALSKMRSILDDYREQNFSQTLFSRFAKEILITADTDGDGKISSQELKAFFKNIGAENCLSGDDIQQMMEEHGEYDGSEYFVYVDDVESIIMQ